MCAGAHFGLPGEQRINQAIGNQAADVRVVACDRADERTRVLAQLGVRGRREQDDGLRIVLRDLGRHRRENARTRGANSGVRRGEQALEQIGSESRCVWRNISAPPSFADRRERVSDHVAEHGGGEILERLGERREDDGSAGGAIVFGRVLAVEGEQDPRERAHRGGARDIGRQRAPAGPARPQHREPRRCGR